MNSWMLALAGGVVIGTAATLLLWLTGRIAGISGILGGVLMPRSGEFAWRAAFLIGLIGAGAAYLWAVPAAYVPRQGFPPVLLVIAGLLVGFGTRMGNGCTSGHGVCGLSRLSVRSLAATLTFIATGAVTVFVMRHVFG